MKYLRRSRWHKQRMTRKRSIWAAGATAVHWEQVNTKQQNGLTIPYFHPCTGSTRCRATECLTVTKLQFSSVPTPQKYEPLQSTQNNSVRNLSICIILGERTQQRKDISFRYVQSFQCRKSEMQDWTCSNTFHNKAQDKGLYICIDAFLAASGMCNPHLWSISNVLGFCLMSFLYSFLNVTATKSFRKVVYIHAWKENIVPIFSFSCSFPLQVIAKL